jgi:uncharacterized membrane protein
MQEWLTIATECVVLIINAMALVMIAIGTLEAFVTGLPVMLTSRSVGHWSRDVWLRFARWLVIGLTFLLAADIVETSIAPSWEDIGRLAAIAAIRTFLNYFLERDMQELGKPAGTGEV